MLKKDSFETIKELSFDTKKIIYEDKKGVELYIFRPSELSKRFKNYDLKKNFQIWIKEGEREFRPNHLRLLIDLNLRVRSRPDLKEKLLMAFDNIFYGEDPEEELEKLNKENFEHCLNDLILIGYLAQLLIIEQEYNYHKESNYNPQTLFLQGWIRQFIISPKEIDNLCMSVVNRQPPDKIFTEKENKKSKKYINNLQVLWYLKDN